jgi:hypothetical protein
MRWDFHGLIIEGTTNDATMASMWQRSFSSLPTSDDAPILSYHIDLVDGVQSPPDEEPIYVHRHLSSYYMRNGDVQIYFPHFGLLSLDIERGVTKGAVVSACLDTYGYLEDLVASGLSPHLRRRGLFMVHAFAAAMDDHFVLLVGDIGTGKTTSGISLLENGWQLMSNDSPIVSQDGRVLCYPGLLSAYPDSLLMFKGTENLAQDLLEGEKKEIDPESLWPNVWRREATKGLILFPQLVADGRHSLTPLSKAETLGRLLPHTIDSWDKSMESDHIAALERLIAKSPSFSLRVGRNPQVLAELIEAIIEEEL